MDRYRLTGSSGFAATHLLSGDCGSARLARTNPGLSAGCPSLLGRDPGVKRGRVDLLLPVREYVFQPFFFQFAADSRCGLAQFGFELLVQRLGIRASGALDSGKRLVHRLQRQLPDFRVLVLQVGEVGFVQLQSFALRRRSLQFGQLALDAATLPKAVSSFLLQVASISSTLAARVRMLFQSSSVIWTYFGSGLGAGVVAGSAGDGAGAGVSVGASSSSLSKPAWNALVAPACTSSSAAGVPGCSVAPLIT